MSTDEHVGMSSFDAMREKMAAGKSAATETYRLSVSGIVTYGPENIDLKNLMLAEGDERARLPEALQELEEQAADIKITMEKLSSIEH